MKALLLVSLAAVVCAACGTSGPGAAPSASTSAGSSAGSPSSASDGTALTITVRESPQSAPQTWTLTCDPSGGTHPDPVAACAQLAALPTPFAPTPKGLACTQIYGGPQTATVTGTYRGRPVNATFSRTDGCEISRWDRLADVLVVRGGA